MIGFNNDYSSIAHERILKKLIEMKDIQVGGYGEDEYCDEARQIIRGLIGNENAAVHFLVGGTQANLTVISTVLRPHQCAVCASTGHINAHETGAIEATGHKVMGIAAKDGKLTAQMIKNVHDAHWRDETHEHIAQPKLVYISQSTEIGTVYTKRDLEEIYKTCKECNMYLFVDGARLSYALASDGCDMDIKFLAANSDVFYIGGTKCGTMFGEAVVITNDALKEDFRYIIKQRGGMFAKGWLMGVQFSELLKDGLYFELADKADKLAKRIKEAALEAGYSLYAESPTNQQFIIFPDEVIERLSKKYTFAYQERIDDTHSAVRICTSWATKEEDAEELIRDIKAIEQ